MTERTAALESDAVLFLDQAGEMGGAQLSLLDLAASYRPTEATVLLFRDGPFRPRLEARGVQVEVAEGGEAFVTVSRSAGPLAILSGLGGLLSLMRHATRLARLHAIVHANSQKALIVGAIPAKLSGRPFVWHLRDLMTAPDVSSTVKLAARLFANGFADLVIANSEATREAFLEIGGKTRVVTIHNGIDASRFGPDITPAPRPVGIPEGAPVLGVFSRLAEWKGQHVAIDALTQIPDAHLILVGGPLFGTKDYEARLIKQVEDLGLAGRVHFLGDQADVAGWMRACDIVVHSSTAAEPFGRVIVEGMLSLKPVIATNAGGVPEIVTDGVDGLLAPLGDAEAMAAAVRRLLDDKPLADRMALAARETAVRRFSVEAYQSNVRAALNDEIKRRRAR